MTLASLDKNTAPSPMREVSVYINVKSRRFYRIMAGIDLLGDFILYQSWGSLDSKLGNVKQQIISPDQLDQLLEEIHIKRVKRYYFACSADQLDSRKQNHRYSLSGTERVKPFETA